MVFLKNWFGVGGSQLKYWLIIPLMLLAILSVVYLFYKIIVSFTTKCMTESPIETMITRLELLIKCIARYVINDYNSVTPDMGRCNESGRRSLEGCSPWGRWGSDTTERLHFHFSLWCIGEGSGNPLQCYCLENPRDRGAWRAAIYGVAQSQTRLKWLSSSNESEYFPGP